ncbi:transcriptional Regulator, LysR family domain protein [Bordetella holmesii 30539]|uniref:Transcriptional Regulator, LysR family domain protein n=1 Tax=Bordetella holmesii 1058 TaxID=1247648 RepID=A0ABN0S3N4_9BORD|nr:transcriptional Regulator, LysR family domain protein [Bordetella holmesii ATCC 51541]AIT26383.1 transcriptional Regulator, LysR family domain protein [Bordetella holmesii 44057]AMD45406.1 hypothetical protein H558_07800 [Bordetella holmesii H558]AMD50590.1 hypothetical protein F783_010300 [Bordetella holmesii F627]AOB34295.1 hypothetical protein BBB42_01560 [Bordetella holmesii]EWM42122.1 transcriptional Regulator, LysR family domain protein [Bordetella holmesii 41130]EWM46956.1 transcrip
MGFQASDLTADRRLGDMQVLRRLRDAHAARDGHKTAHKIERWQFSEGEWHSKNSCHEAVKVA